MFQTTPLPAALFCLFSMVFFFGACVSSGPYPLIVSHEAVSPGVAEKIATGEGVFGAARRAVQVRLDENIARAENISPGDEIVLQLFDKTKYRALVERVSITALETTSIRARFTDAPSGYVILSSNAGRSMVHIRIPRKNLEYVIFFDPETQSHYLLDIDPSKKDRIGEAPAIIPPSDNP